MRILKLAIISVVVIFIILTAMSALLPSQVLVSRAVDIRGTDSTAREYLFELGNWQHWMSDENGLQAPHSYDSISRKLTVGPATIHAQSRSDTTFVTAWHPGNALKATFRIIPHNTPQPMITVQWQMEQKVKWYPWEKFASITKDEIWGGSMEESLDNLKQLIESR